MVKEKKEEIIKEEPRDTSYFEGLGEEAERGEIHKEKPKKIK